MPEQMSEVIHVAVEPSLKNALEWLAERDMVSVSFVIRVLLRRTGDVKRAQARIAENCEPKPKGKKA
jgi:hypothetical protein